MVRLDKPNRTIGEIAQFVGGNPKVGRLDEGIAVDQALNADISNGEMGADRDDSARAAEWRGRCGEVIAWFRRLLTDTDVIYVMCW